MIKDPAEKKVFVAISDVFAEYGDSISGNKKDDKIMINLFNKYVKDGNRDDLSKLSKMIYNLTGDPSHLLR